MNNNVKKLDLETAVRLLQEEMFYDKVILRNIIKFDYMTYIHFHKEIVGRNKIWRELTNRNPTTKKSDTLFGYCLVRDVVDYLIDNIKKVFENGVRIS
jgi:hypothetical protein